MFKGQDWDPTLNVCDWTDNHKNSNKNMILLSKLVENISETTDSEETLTTPESKTSTMKIHT